MTQEAILAEFSLNIKRLMACDGIKQSDIATQLRVSKAQVSDWCAGKNLPRSNYLGALTDLFHCDLCDLMGSTNGDLTIGPRIKAFRECANLTQEELGRACGTTKQTIYKYEAGTVTNIPLDRLELIAKALHVSRATLVGWEQPHEAQTGRKNNGAAIAQQIKQHRKALGLNQTEFGKLLGVKTCAVSKWECGRVVNIPTAKIKAMAEIFHVPVSALVDEDYPLSGSEPEEYLEILQKRPECCKLLSAVKNATEDEVNKAIAIIEILKKD